MRLSLRLGGALVLASSALTLAAGQAAASSSATRTAPRVLLVCNGSVTPCPATKHHQYRTVQAAVNAATPGNWILIWPGVYHQNNPTWHAGV
jgi:pectin methylesterase-like acyl-CoA thioesterase